MACLAVHACSDGRLTRLPLDNDELDGQELREVGVSDEALEVEDTGDNFLCNCCIFAFSP
jgi:hypothetical protein